MGDDVVQLAGDPEPFLLDGAGDQLGLQRLDVSVGLDQLLPFQGLLPGPVAEDPGAREEGEVDHQIEGEQRRQGGGGGELHVQFRRPQVDQQAQADVQSHGDADDGPGGQRRPASGRPRPDRVERQEERDLGCVEIHPGGVGQGDVERVDGNPGGQWVASPPDQGKREQQTTDQLGLNGRGEGSRAQDEGQPGHQASPCHGRGGDDQVLPQPVLGQCA